jgi:hypothetical protein
MAKIARKRKRANLGLGVALRTEPLHALIAELQQLRQYPPLVHKGKGKYEGDILGFVRGLRLSARIAYFVRDQLNDTKFRTCWGHLLDDAERSCSPECDVIIHKKGHIRAWNGFKKSIMNFKFIRAQEAIAIISCKSKLKSIDTDYAKGLKKFGIKHVLLFAETCSEKSFQRLRRTAKRAGYQGLWCLYLTAADGSMKTIKDSIHMDFIKTVKKVASS